MRKATRKRLRNARPARAGERIPAAAPRATARCPGRPPVRRACAAAPCGTQSRRPRRPTRGPGSRNRTVPRWCRCRRRALPSRPARYSARTGRRRSARRGPSGSRARSTRWVNMAVSASSAQKKRAGPDSWNKEIPSANRSGAQGEPGDIPGGQRLICVYFDHMQLPRGQPFAWPVLRLSVLLARSLEGPRWDTPGSSRAARSVTRRTLRASDGRGESWAGSSLPSWASATARVRSCRAWSITRAARPRPTARSA